MDAKILKNIISSSTPPNKVGQSDEVQEEEFPTTTMNSIDKLSKTFTRLLSYKVSQEAIQRYSVRLNIIDTLRDWSKIKGDMGKLPLFQDTEQSYTFLVHLLRKYLTEETLSNCDSTENLIQVAEILYNSISTKRSLMKSFARVIERIISLEQTEKSKKFLQNIVDKSDQLKLETDLVERIYISQKSWLIEKPLTDCFVAYCSDKDNMKQLDDMNILFEKIIDSPTLFELISHQLREMFVGTKYSDVAQNFIKLILEKIRTFCNKFNKDTLDLYPTSLQSCVILLRIQPAHHSEKSKAHTIQSLKDIFLKDRNNALVLVSHFPDWLPQYQKFFEDNFDEDTQQSSDDEVMEL